MHASSLTSEHNRYDFTSINLGQKESCNCANYLKIDNEKFDKT